MSEINSQSVENKTILEKLNNLNFNRTLQTEYVNNNLNTNINHKNATRDFYIGLSLALLSSFFIGSSFILKKKGLLKLCGSTNLTSTKRAAQGGYGYLKEWLWWSGLATMGIGELCNFAAYGFVPATLVTPLGALSVLISAIMSAYFLNEKLNTIGKIGCILTAIGSTVMVIHAPKEGEIKTVREMLFRIQDIEFVCFTILSSIALLFLIFVLVPRYGNTNVLIYILICSILGSFTVMSCKGLSLGIKEIFLNRPSVSFVYTYLFALLVVICIIIQMNYLNKSLDIFNTPIVTTVYYVLFTLFVMIASSLLFKELLNVSFQDFIGCMCGFFTIICALFLIQFFKTSDDYLNKSESNDSKHNNNYDSNILNLILNNSKNSQNNHSTINRLDMYTMNELNNINANESNYSQTSFELPKTKMINEYTNNNQNLDMNVNNNLNSNNKSLTQSPSDLVQKVTIFKTAKLNDNLSSTNSNNNNNNNLTDNLNTKTNSLFKKITNLQNSYFLNKFKKYSNGPSYNYNKLISDDNYDNNSRDNDYDEDDLNQTITSGEEIVYNKNNKKYSLLNNSYESAKKKDLDLNFNNNNSKNRKPVTRRESNKNLSFDEKLFNKNSNGCDSEDEINTTSTSLIILKS